jgi:hypothetical protein
MSYGRRVDAVPPRPDLELAQPNVDASWRDDDWRSWGEPLDVVRGEAYRRENLGTLIRPTAEGQELPVSVVLTRERRTSSIRTRYAPRSTARSSATSSERPPAS